MMSGLRAVNDEPSAKIDSPGSSAVKPAKRVLRIRLPCLR
jgi:hypothetical protein